MRSTRKLWRLWLIGVAVLWLAAFTLVPEQPSPPALARPAERWELPAVPVRHDLATAAGVMANSALWGKPPATTKTAEPPTDERWLLAATFIPQDRPGRAVVRFAAADKRPQTLTVGDNLPNGAKIESIEASRVCVIHERRRNCLPVPVRTPREF